MKIRVLLVDDHQLMREALRSILEKESNIEVVGEAGDGEQAVLETVRLHPDVVLMDVAMRDLNGIEATRRIREALPGARVLALSSYADRRYVNAMLRAGACGYVLKANAYEELRRAVYAVAAGKTYLCAEVAEDVVETLRRAPEQVTVYERVAPREREVLQLLAEGLSSPEIAQTLGVSTSTVETHRRNLMRKLDLHSVAELTKYAVREGLTTLDP
jgi:two-component system NarL family response regulator